MVVMRFNLSRGDAELLRRLVMRPLVRQHHGFSLMEVVISMFVLGIGSYAVYMQSSTQASTSQQRSLYLKMHDIKAVAIENLHSYHQFFPILKNELYYQCFDRRGMATRRGSSLDDNKHLDELGTLVKNEVQSLNECRRQQEPKPKCYAHTQNAGSGDNPESSFICSRGSQYLLMIEPKKPLSSSPPTPSEYVYILRVMALNPKTGEVQLALRTKLHKNTGY